MPQARVGGSFAPPIDDEKLAQYEATAKACSDRKCSSYMLDLVKMLKTFRQTPASQQASRPHPSGVGTITQLEDAEVERIWDVVPWPEECDVMGKAFDSLQGDERQAAYHLLWFGRELAADREPLTNDRL